MRNRPLIRNSAIALVAVVLAIMVFFHFTRQEVSSSEPVPKLHTVCVGRLLVDLPQDMEPDGDVELYYGLGRDFQTAKLEIVQLQADKPAFDTVVARRLATLTQDVQDATPSKNKLADTRRLDDRTTLILAHDEPVMHGYFLAEILFMRGGSIGRLTRHVYDKDNPKDIEARLIDLVGRINAVDDPLRAGKGTCLGSLLIDGDQDGEDFTLSMRSSRFPDVVVGIAINSMIAQDDGGLLKRVDGKQGVLAALGATGTTIRRGKTSISGRAAEELVTSVKEHGKVSRQFDAETLLLKPSTFEQPQIHVDMSMGGQVPNGDYVDPSWSEPAGLELWEAIVKSVRLRPGAI